MGSIYIYIYISTPEQLPFYASQRKLHFFEVALIFGTQVLVTLHGGGHQKLLSFNLRQRGVRCPFALVPGFHKIPCFGPESKVAKSWLVPLKIRIGIRWKSKGVEILSFEVGDLTSQKKDDKNTDFTRYSETENEKTDQAW